ncbi:LysR family transcriptional regulator [Nocardia arthritidis]|uniref:LysR family transcriptional regulator n=1 Tax=Nocardia arthritidis TaxID=228602 RepID=A0A6G9YRY8_9NOCA|nr:LysR family transcriptional regulator [Nocardia arthritidis]QIS15867.1 LysR family transcriptional regulator [Nocardia arthritidis]
MGEFTIAGLRVVREAAATGSFSTAAEHLGYTQSAVSRQIALMERAAGKPLFERQARGVRPTEAGRILVRHADAVLGELDTARQDLSDLESLAPVRIRVGGFSTAMSALLPRAIATLVARHPAARVPLREGLSPRLLTAVAAGRLDLAVVPTPAEIPDGVVVEHLLDDPLLVAVAPDHPLADQLGVTPDRLRDQRWIAGSADPGSTLLGAWYDPAQPPDIAFVARDWFAKLGLVAAGMGSTVVPGIAVPVLPSTVALVRIDHPDAVRRTAVVYRTTLRDDRVRRDLTEALRDAAAHLSALVRQRLR